MDAEDQQRRRLRLACAGKSLSQGGMNIDEIMAIARSRGIFDAGSRAEWIARICNPIITGGAGASDADQLAEWISDITKLLTANLRFGMSKRRLLRILTSAVGTLRLITTSSLDSSLMEFAKIIYSDATVITGVYESIHPVGRRPSPADIAAAESLIRSIPDIRQSLILYLAISLNDLEIVHLIHKIPGIDINYQSGSRESPLLVAIRELHSSEHEFDTNIDIIQLLLNAPDLIKEPTLLQKVLSKLDSPSMIHKAIAVIPLLLAAGYPVTVECLCLAIESGYEALINLFLEHPDIDIYSICDDMTPLELAIAKGDIVTARKIRRLMSSWERRSHAVAIWKARNV